MCSICCIKMSSHLSTEHLFSPPLWPQVTGCMVRHFKYIKRHTVNGGPTYNGFHVYSMLHVIVSCLVKHAYIALVNCHQHFFILLQTITKLILLTS